MNFTFKDTPRLAAGRFIRLDTGLPVKIIVLMSLKPGNVLDIQLNKLYFSQYKLE